MPALRSPRRLQAEARGLSVLLQPARERLARSLPPPRAARRPRDAARLPRAPACGRRCLAPAARTFSSRARRSRARAESSACRSSSSAEPCRSISSTALRSRPACSSRRSRSSIVACSRSVCSSSSRPRSTISASTASSSSVAAKSAFSRCRMPSSGVLRPGQCSQSRSSRGCSCTSVASEGGLCRRPASSAVEFGARPPAPAISTVRHVLLPPTGDARSGPSGQDRAWITTGARHLAARLRAGVSVGTTIVLERDDADPASVPAIAVSSARSRPTVSSSSGIGGSASRIDPRTPCRTASPRNRLSPGSLRSVTSTSLDLTSLPVATTSAAPRIACLDDLERPVGFRQRPPERAPKSIVITQVGSPPNVPPAELAWSEPIPTSRHSGFSMLSRWAGDSSHALIARRGVDSRRCCRGGSRRPTRCRSPDVR